MGRVKRMRACLQTEAAYIDYGSWPIATRAYSWDPRQMSMEKGVKGPVHTTRSVGNPQILRTRGTG